MMLAASAPPNELSEVLFTQILRSPLEPTPLSLEPSFEEGETALSLRVSALPAITAEDVDLEIMLPLCDYFRLVRIAVRVRPSISSMLGPGESSSAILNLISNMELVAVLEIPVAGVGPGASVPTTQRLKIAVKRDPLSGSCVLVEIPIPTGITLRPGAAISLSGSIAGSPVTLQVPASGHFHSATCSHDRKPAGAVTAAVIAGDAAAVKAALTAGGSTEEIDGVRNTAPQLHLCVVSFFSRCSLMILL